MSLPDWARAHGPSLFAAIIRSVPEDFEVTEELGWQLTGDGEHDYLWVEKTGANTEWVARQLARFAAVPVKDVGFAGLKDRHAVTRQWFSVPRWNAPAWQALEVEGAEVLDVQRHHRKLKRGVHRANRFRIVLRGELPPSAAVADRIAGIETAGVPNYFGEQRFGRAGGNLQLTDDWAAGRRLPRHKRSIAISTARSYLFNEQLDARVREGTWNRIVAGDVVNLDGSGSVFQADDVDDELERRAAAMDVHPAGGLWGDGRTSSATASNHTDWRSALVSARVKTAHRSLRLRIDELEWSIADESLTLAFRLGRGAFATAVLREIAQYDDGRLRSPALSGN